jgi:hypothetical protein
MRSLLVLICLAMMLTPFAVRAEEDNGDAAEEGGEVVDPKAKLKELKEALKSRDPDARVQAIQSAAGVRDKGIAGAIAKCLSDKSPEVRAAAGRALGQQGDQKYRGKLLARLKNFDKEDPVALKGYLAGLQGLPDVKSIKDLTDMIKKIMYREREAEKEVGIEAAKALGKVKDKRAVAELIVLLEMTDPKSGGSGGTVSQATRKFRGDFRPSILDGLSHITDEHFKDAIVWQTWWKGAEKRFKVPEGARDVNASATYTDYGYRFRVKKPKDTWVFVRPGGETGIVRLGHRQEEGGAAMDASITVTGYETSRYTTNSPSAAIDYWNEWAADESKGFRDIKDGFPVNKDVVFAREKAKLWECKGLTAAGTVKFIRKYILLRNGILLTISIETLSGVSPELQKDLDKAVASFTFMK